MAAQIDNYCTTPFILKDQQSVEYINKLCKLLCNKENLYEGDLSQDSFCIMVPYGKEPNSFYIKTNGYIDSGPELRCSSVWNEHQLISNTNNLDEQPINLWIEIQKNLKDETWFFIDGYAWDNTSVHTFVQFFHQDGRTEFFSNYDIKKKILKDMNI